MLNLSEKTHVSIRPASDFTDFQTWLELARSRLTRYPLPDEAQPCTTEQMETWLDRLDLTEKQFLQTGNYESLQEFIDLNPDWPLMAFIGLCLELDNEGE